MLDPPVLVSVSDCVSVVPIGMLPKPTVEGEVEGWPEVVGPPDAHRVVRRTSPYAVTLRKVRRFTASPLLRRAFAAQRGIEKPQLLHSAVDGRAWGDHERPWRSSQWL
jgi:hypothetical protein